MKLLISLLFLFVSSPAFSKGAQFEKKKIRLAGKTITVEVADTNERRARGLMFRTELPEDQGMLFIFDREQPLSFWMKNTLIPLSIGYFDKQKKLIDVQEMEPAVAGEISPRSYPSKRPGQYALEMPKGWFTKHKVILGTTFAFIDR